MVFEGFFNSMFAPKNEEPRRNRNTIREKLRKEKEEASDNDGTEMVASGPSMKTFNPDMSGMYALSPLIYYTQVYVFGRDNPLIPLGLGMFALFSQLTVAILYFIYVYDPDRSYQKSRLVIMEQLYVLLTTFEFLSCLLIGHYFSKSRYLENIVARMKTFNHDTKPAEIVYVLRTLLSRVFPIIWFICYVIPSTIVFINQAIVHDYIGVKIVYFFFQLMIMLQNYICFSLYGLWLWVCYCGNELVSHYVDSLDEEAMKESKPLMNFITISSFLEEISEPWTSDMSMRVLVLLSRIYFNTYVALVIFDWVTISGVSAHFYEIFIFILCATLAFIFFAILFTLTLAAGYVGDKFVSDSTKQIRRILISEDDVIRRNCVELLQVLGNAKGEAGFLFCGTEMSMQKATYLTTILTYLATNLANSQ
jgi:hypothetical protein